mmetsp:Transcript_10448/g.29529  ORF Transcript_10448/g.29529 Transcript_10448/m.29529 type:complete len:250 (+) Transcript_10448:67-816(+)
MEDAGGSSRSVLNEAAERVKAAAPARLTKCMRITNMLNAVLLGASGVISFTLLGQCADQSDCGTSSMAVLAFYTLLFAVLLLLFEMRVNSTRGWISKNCGFMYSNRGKAILLLFLATLCFSTMDSGLTGLWWMPLLAGIVTTINGLFVCITVYLHPSFDAYTTAYATEEMDGIGATAGRETAGAGFNGAAPPPASNYAFGDAGAGGSEYPSYELQDPGYSAPFAAETVQPPRAPPSDNPFASDNPFSNV